MLISFIISIYQKICLAAKLTISKIWQKISSISVKMNPGNHAVRELLKSNASQKQTLNQQQHKIRTTWS